MKQATMVYKYPGTMHVCNVTKDGFDYKVIEADDVDQALEEGWFESTNAAKAAAEAKSDDDSPPTREELEQMATELEIDFDGRTTDKKLQAKIEEKLNSSPEGFM